MRLLLVGDICPAANVEKDFVEGNFDSLFTDAISIFDNVDYTVANLECALTDHNKPIIKNGPPLKTKPAIAKQLRKLGVTHCGISNNHVFDFGKKGLADTIKYLTEAGIAYTGVGENAEDARKDMLITKDGQTIAIIAVCEHEYSYALENRVGCREYDVYKTIEDIRAAKEKADRVVVMYHGGKEYCHYPSPRLVDACHAMVRAGADVVLAQHTHCIGCYEKYNDAHILYGQGNFHFLSVVGVPMPSCWNEGLALHYDTVKNELEFTFCVNGETGIELAKGERLAKLQEEFDQRKQSMIDGTWKQGWKDFCESMRAEYVEKIRDALQTPDYCKAYNMLGHYLDCEAHHDLIKELFPTANQTNEL